MTKPFIYICSLRRTGSTVISEALTLFPYSFIFREPRLADRRFALKEHDVKLFRAHAIDLESFASRWQAKPISHVTLFRKELLPHLLDVCTQVGVKEIRNKGWREYIRAFPAIRMVLTARDPRDIFLSLHDRVQSAKSSWKGSFGPKELAAHLCEEFEYQMAASEAAPSFRVRYEDFCTNHHRTLDALKEFVESDIPGLGSIGALNASNPNRRSEYELHGHEVTAKRVVRWQTEPNSMLRDQAFRMLDLMPAYCKYWDYSADTPAASTY